MPNLLMRPSSWEDGELDWDSDFDSDKEVGKLSLSWAFADYSIKFNSLIYSNIDSL
jgi:hypothetical protein